jgi:hypothetical protein
MRGGQVSYNKAEALRGWASWGGDASSTEIRQAQHEFTIHPKLNLKIICNTMEKNPYGQTWRGHESSAYLRLNFVVLPGFSWRDDAS